MTSGRRTIFALSSGRPPCAVAVVRISGPEARAALTGLASSCPPPRRASVRKLRNRDGTVLDEALVLWLPGPATATGEDVVELHLHGGRAVIAAVQASLSEMPGLRLAEAGEFTRRAFFNGKMDLLQAEGLADLLEAESEAQRRHALSIAEGGLSREIDDFRRDLLDLSAQAEAAIDYDEDEDLSVELDAVAAGAMALADRIDDRLSWVGADRLRSGVHVLLAGPPNAGKSSLFNALVRREAALVSDVPGTTRDLLEASLSLRGVPVLLIDSAGIWDDSDDGVEQMGIARAKSAVARADIVLWLGDPSDAPAGAVKLHARADLPERIQLPVACDLAVSAHSGAGLSSLADIIVDKARSILPDESSVGISERHRLLLAEGAAALRQAGEASDIVLTAYHLQFARAALDRLVGRTATEEMLDHLFARFCVGK